MHCACIVHVIVNALCEPQLGTGAVDGDAGAARFGAGGWVEPPSRESRWPVVPVVACAHVCMCAYAHLTESIWSDRRIHALLCVSLLRVSGQYIATYSNWTAEDVRSAS